MNMKETIRTMSTLLLMTVAMVIFACTFTACSDDEMNDNTDETLFLRPLTKNLFGIWKQTNNYMLQDGKWIEDPIPEMYVNDLVFCPGGIYYHNVRREDGKTYMFESTWSADETADTLKVNGEGIRLGGLTENEFIVLDTTATDHATGEVLKGEFKWVYTRVNQPTKTAYTQLLGRWQLQKRFQEQDGQWVEVTQDMPDYCAREYDMRGSCALYTLTGDKFETKRYSGCVGEIAKWGEPADILSQWDICSQARVEIRLCSEDENTVHIYHPDNYDSEAEKMVPGGHKDVFVRMK